MQSSNKYKYAPAKLGLLSVSLFLFLILFVQISFSATAKWTKSTSTTYADPVIYADSIYVAANIGPTTGIIYKFDKSEGKQIWSTSINGTIFVSPAVYGDYVYVGTSEGVFSLNRLTGDVVSQYSTLPQKVLTSPLINGEDLFVVLENKVLIFDISDNGNIAKPTTVNLNGNTDSSTFINGEGISLFLTDGRLVYITPIGTSETTFNLGRTIWKASPTISGDIVYFGSERRLYAISTSGVIYWYKDFNGWVSPPLVSGNKIYVGCNDGYLYVLNKSSGNINASFKTDDAVLKPVVSKTTIYIPSKDNNIYAADINTLEQKWNMTLDDWPSTPLLSGAVLYTVSYNGTLYAASTLGCGISDPPSGARVTTKARISGVAYTDTELRSVEVKIGDGAWNIAKFSGGKWSIDYPISRANSGDNLTVQCRASDNISTEIEPYSSISVIFVSSEDRLPKIIATYPEKVTSGNEFTLEFKNESGNPLPGVTVRYANQDYEAVNGTVKITATEGETTLYINKPNYKTEVVTIQVELPSFMVYLIPIAIFVVIILIIAILFLTRKWR